MVADSDSVLCHRHSGEVFDGVRSVEDLADFGLDDRSWKVRSGVLGDRVMAVVSSLVKIMGLSDQ